MPDETATAPPPAAPTGDPFGGQAPAPAAPEPAAPAPEPATPAEPQAPAPDDGTPDLSEEGQVLMAKLEGIEGRLPKPEDPASELTDTEVASQLLGRTPAPPADQNADPNVVTEDEYGRYIDQAGNVVPPEMVVTVDEFGNEVSAAQQQQQQQPQGDPRLDQVISYIEARETAEKEKEILALAEQNPDLREPAMMSAVEAHAETLAREAGNPALATSPTYVRAALALARSERATPPQVPADQARNQGATLPTDAGASVDGSPSSDDQWWNGVKGAGGDAFPS